MEIKKELTRSYLTLDTQDAVSLIEQYREILNSHRAGLRKLLFKESDIASKVGK